MTCRHGETMTGASASAIKLSLLVIAIFFFGCSSKQVTSPLAVFPLPDSAQLAWHRMERNAFVHFTINTFTGKEWGYGDENESLLNPSSMNPVQWAQTLQQAGFKGVILTCKHHDGFCLWPSDYTTHSIKKSPWKNGKGDLVREVSDAVRREGMKFGIYVSPWDRNRADYGTAAYITAYRNQLHELFQNYGPIFEMWFDGANGGDGYYGGAREKRNINGATYYDWSSTLAGVRSMSPSVIFFSDAGPGVRWVGNERGEAGETNWNSITPDTLYAGKAGIENLLNTGNEKGSRWIPAETDVSIRPGWFYHENEDSLVKTPERLFEIYLTSVGRGSTLLLNVPPDKRGLIAKKDSVVLRQWNAMIAEEFKVNYALGKTAKPDSYRGNAAEYSGAKAIDGDNETYWATDDNVTTGTLEIDLERTQLIKYAVLQEYIKLGQRVRHFYIEIMKDGKWKQVAAGTTIGYKRIVRFPPVETNKIRVVVSDSRACPLISEVGFF